MAAIFMNVAMATACGNKRRQGNWPARHLYESPRIKHLERWCRDIRVPFYILSAEYGLISGDQIVASYQRVMDPARAAELTPQVAKVLSEWEVLVFFKAAGLAASDTAEAVVAAARRWSPEYPGKLDLGAWHIGRQWCRPTGPDCGACPLTSACPKLIDRGTNLVGV